MVLKELINGKN